MNDWWLERHNNMIYQSSLTTLSGERESEICGKMIVTILTIVLLTSYVRLICKFFYLAIRFVKGRPGRGTGYDLDEDDILEMEQCRGIVVVSAIFGTV